MQCDKCGKNPAVYHVTQIINNETSTRHLCDTCAAEMGLESGVSAETAPLTDFLAQMGKGLAGAAGSSPGACEFCGLTMNDFKRTGRLGCPHCYSHFDQHLRGLLRKLHGGTQHMGKVYLPPDPRATDRTARIASLRRSLQRAVDSEDFERAAVLRDQIRRMETASD
ncbi:MAG TPA: UvrB/UvrC motif-containing protein [Longimicrobiaceae bacterium]|nr:UvrB/UvrC motif-containing protein [Longimicrobiaceae bacterium]